MNYEEKYKQALKRAKKLQKTCDSQAVIGWCEYLFPELKESEDEKIRKKLICFVENWKKFNPNSPFDDYAVYTSDSGECDKILAWLEKQGEQTTDKVEPKFKVGDFITNDYCLGKVIEITNDAYLLDTGQGIPFSCENTHLWTIADAKDGDVLVDEDNNIGLYSGEKDDLDWHSCVYLGCDDYFRGSMGYHKHKNTKPATKEQRDLLFKKMKEAGYEWYSEKKELKKIVSQKTLDPDRVIEWMKTHGNLWPRVTIKINEVIDKFKQDFDL